MLTGMIIGTVFTKHDADWYIVAGAGVLVKPSRRVASRGTTTGFDGADSRWRPGPVRRDTTLASCRKRKVVSIFLVMAHGLKCHPWCCYKSSLKTVLLLVREAAGFYKNWSLKSGLSFGALCP